MSNPGTTLATLSDGAISEAWRLIGCSPEPEPSPKKPRRPPRVHVILDANVVKRRLRVLGLTATGLAKQLRLKIWDVESLVDYGEVSVAEAEKLARALGVDITDITFGVRNA